MHGLIRSLRMRIQNLGISDARPRPAHQENAQHHPLAKYNHGPDKESSTKVSACRAREKHYILWSCRGKPEPFRPY